MDNKKLNEQELEQVTGGDIDFRKDHYENIILSDSLISAVNGEVKKKCPKCFLYIDAGKYDNHVACCKGNA